MAALVVAATVTGSSLASTSPATGTGTIVPDITSIQPLGANTLLTDTALGGLTGTLAGTINQSGVELVFPNGNGVFTQSGTFAGTLGDCGPVNLHYLLVLHGSLANYSGEAIGGGSAGPGYEIQITGGGSAFTYAGEYHC